LNAGFQGTAPAVEQMFKKRFQSSSALNIFVNFPNFAVREFLPAWSNRSVTPQAI
jgi:hypothetical protein